MLPRFQSSRLLLLAFFLLAGTARGQTEYFVATNGDDSRVGTGGWGDALLTISNAVAKATTAGDIITVSNGTYNITNEISVSAAITIRSFGNGVYGGLDNAAATIVKRNSGTCRIFNITAAATVDGFTIRDGNSGSGGGVYMTASGATVKNCMIMGNVVNAEGGGVYMSDGVVSNCTISGNRTGWWDKNGGGVFMDGGVLVACRIRGNSTGGWGGGVYMNKANAAVRNCLIYGNKAYFENADMRNGGGVYMSAGTVENCTIVANTAASEKPTCSAGGIYRAGGTVRNCIVYNNTASDTAYMNIRNADANVTHTCTTNPVSTGADCITADPLFRDTAVGNYGLRSGSPCIDAGTNVPGWMTAGVKDLVGNERVQDGNNDGTARVDMGAYEYNAALNGDFIGNGRVLVTSPFTYQCVGPAPFTVQFIGTAYGTNRTGVVYRWDFEGTGAWSRWSADNTASHTYSAAGVYSPKLQVSNAVAQVGEIVKPGYVSAGSTYYVKQGGAGDFTSWANAGGTISSAVARCTFNGDQVLVSTGTYNTTATIVPKANLFIRSFSNGVTATTIAAATIVKYSGGVSVLSTNGVKTAADGFTIPDYLDPSVWWDGVKPRFYVGNNLTGIELPVGGIGAGCVLMDGAAQRTAWMFWDPWTKAPVTDSFFAVRVRVGNGKPGVRAMQTTPIGDLKGLEALAFTGDYPFGRYDFRDPAYPLKLSLETYSPLVPPDEKDSGMPCAIYSLTAENTNREPVEVSFLATQQNPVGFRKGYAGNSNRVVRLDGMTVVELTTTQPPDGEEFGGLALAALAPEAVACASWEGLPRLVERFADDGRVQGPLSAASPATGQTVNAAMAVPFVLQPGERRTVTFALAWHFPNVRQHWGYLPATNFWKGKLDWSATAVGRQYANWWPDALAVARDLAARLPELERRTRLFHDTLYASNLPRWLRDGLSSQIAILRSPATFWNRDGYFGCFEGYREYQHGEYRNDGNCNHVLQYAQLHAYLFPSIARNLRDSEFALQHDDGRLSHRQTAAHHGPQPALDGSCGAVLGSYREYLMSADPAWLNGSWPKVKKAMESIIATWDLDEDGVVGGAQWTTMDGAVNGSTTWMGSLYLAALSAAERMARLQNDATAADRYREIRLRGSGKQDAELFNGEYYIQKGGGEIGTGCASDQLLGQWWAHQLDLGWLYPTNHVRTALTNMVRYNFFPSFHGVPRGRKYASDGDSGMMMFTWPKGDRPGWTFEHVLQSWAGSEYAVAALLIQSGMMDDGLKVAKAVRDRYDGRKRPEWSFASGGSPFSEVEWGSYYTRSLSIWSLLTACQGYRYDGPAGAIGFDPVWQPDDHASFFTVAEGWGLFTQKRDPRGQTNTIELRYGRLRLSALTMHLSAPADRVRTQLTVDGKAVKATPQADGQRLTLRLESPLEMQAPCNLVARFELER